VRHKSTSLGCDQTLVPASGLALHLVIEEESLTHGYALSDSQVRKGKDEEKAELVAPGSQRKSRAASMTGNETLSARFHRKRVKMGKKAPWGEGRPF